MSNPNACAVRVVAIERFERPVTLRLPFRFGAATVTHCPQAFVRARIEIKGKPYFGAAAELMVPKWFDKRPAFTHEQNFEQLREALRIAAQAYTDADEGTPFLVSQTAGAAAIEIGVSRGLPRLAAQFGTALLDKAVADAALQAAGLSWVDGVSAGVLGDPYHTRLSWQKPASVALRHTVGMADMLGDEDPASWADLPRDGLPVTLSQAVAHYGLRWFKLKLGGQTESDLERLTRIAAVLDAQAGDYRATLDGNESFADPDRLAAFWNAARSHAPLSKLMPRVLLLEQPLPRAQALEHSIGGLGIDVPVILDESDDANDVLERGIALGYRGISSKACKGIYRSMHSALRIAADPARLLLSGEDLTCQAGLAVQQDTLLAASLGVTHIERNGHHYVDGFGIAPDSEAAAFAQALPDFYESTSGRPRLAVRQGHLQLGALMSQTGFGAPVQPDWSQLQSLL
ncbi:hypothetical protein QTH91_05485 [Variovorax dokdonensis]|uniref:Mandelate racemase n=1 Tax=Variovorax dokdonensis TaxID=344883 RepID=A0ABT7N7R4_9BURK|nr:hypothetical protein [Variovorax dokdonensis]MDM0043925.1 hypothetical protein [Variovorax dokdonensis]